MGTCSRGVYSPLSLHGGMVPRLLTEHTEQMILTASVSHGQQMAKCNPLPSFVDLPV